MDDGETDPMFAYFLRREFERGLVCFGRQGLLTRDVVEDTAGGCSFAYRAGNLFKWVVQSRSPLLSDGGESRSGGSCCLPPVAHLCNDRPTDYHGSSRGPDLHQSRCRGFMEG